MKKKMKNSSGLQQSYEAQLQKMALNVFGCQMSSSDDILKKLAAGCQPGKTHSRHFYAMAAQLLRISKQQKWLLRFCDTIEAMAKFAVDARK